MDDKKYSIGTKIKYIGTYSMFFDSERLTGMVGTIVDIVEGYPLVYLPAAFSVSRHSTKEQPATIQTSWCKIELLAQKGEQLLFDFMQTGG